MRSRTVIVLSGPIAAGKTTLATELSRSHAAAGVSSSGLLSAQAGRELSRGELQRLGREDPFQDGDWLVTAVREQMAASAVPELVVVDAVRTVAQVRALRLAAMGHWRTVHVHLTGSVEQLASRHRARAQGLTWHQAMKAPTEASVDALQAEADSVIDTTRLTPRDLVVRVAACAGWIRPAREPCVDVLIGGQWGSEGKGNLAFFLAPEYGLLVRSGAPNAGHKVRCPDGSVYTHRQLPSGSRATDARLLLAAGAVIDLSILTREIADCGIPSARLTIDPNALIIEDSDVIDEAALRQAIGSTGTGGGAAVARRILQRGSPGGVRTARDVRELAPYVGESAPVFERAFARSERVFIEGTQGTGLSLLHGSFPHVTSRDTTVGTLLAETGMAPRWLRRVIVAFRTYPIRVGGHSGPMGHEITWDTVAERSGLPAAELKVAELGSVSGNPRRVAEFSWTQLESATRLNGATDIALTFADYLDARNRQARRFEQLSPETATFIHEIEAVAQAPVSLISTGFDGRGLIDRRHW